GFAGSGRSWGSLGLSRHGGAAGGGGCLDVLHGGGGGQGGHADEGGGGGGRPSSPKMASRTVGAIGGPAVSTAVCLVTSRWGLRVRGQQRCRSRSQSVMSARESSSR